MGWGGCRCPDHCQVNYYWVEPFLPSSLCPLPSPLLTSNWPIGDHWPLLPQKDSNYQLVQISSTERTLKCGAPKNNHVTACLHLRSLLGWKYLNYAPSRPPKYCSCQQSCLQYLLSTTVTKQGSTLQLASTLCASIQSLIQVQFILKYFDTHNLSNSTRCLYIGHAFYFCTNFFYKGSFQKLETDGMWPPSPVLYLWNTLFAHF